MSLVHVNSMWLVRFNLKYIFVFRVITIKSENKIKVSNIFSGVLMDIQNRSWPIRSRDSQSPREPRLHSEYSMICLAPADRDDI